MSGLTPEQELAFLRAQQAQGNAITMQGINKYWPQIVAIIALGAFLWNQGKEQQALINRVVAVERSVDSISQVKADQVKVSGEVRELQIAVSNISTSQKEISARIESLGSEIRAVGSQVSAISQALRAER